MLRKQIFENNSKNMFEIYIKNMYICSEENPLGQEREFNSINILKSVHYV